MENINFSNGFEKKAFFTMLGTMAGSIGAGVYTMKKNIKAINELHQHNKKDGEDAKKLYKGIQKYMPKDTMLITKTDIEKAMKKEDDFEKHQVLAALRSATEFNAAAVDKKHSKMLKKYVPKEWHDKNLILTDDKIAPSILYHEAGHVIDFDDVAKKNFIGKMMNALKPNYFSETAAWDKAPGKTDSHVKETALGTYRRGYLPLLGTLAGAGLGLYADSKLKLL